MAMKLYQFDCKINELTHPQEFDGSMPKPLWHEDGMATLDEDFAAVIKKLNPDVNVRKGDAACKEAVKKILQDAHRYKILKEIRKDLSVEDEFKALRTDDKTVKDKIAKIVADAKTERDSKLDIS